MTNMKMDVAREVLDRHYLTPLFEPGSVAIVGASEKSGKVGAVLLSNMLAAGYRGTLFAVNPKYGSVRGVRCYASIGKLPERVDLAVIATPAHTVPEVIDECGRSGVRAAVVITAGFSEAGPEGAKLERALLDNARRHGVRLVGPNCLGILRPELGLNATFARGTALAGSLGLVSQSGAVCAAMLDWAAPNRIGFSSVVSLGGSIDIDFGEIIDYLANDPKTEHILLYIEGIRDARRFLSSLRAAARVKPIIVMKVGRHPARRRRAGEQHRPARRRGAGARLARAAAGGSARGDHQRRRPGRDGRRPCRGSRSSPRRAVCGHGGIAAAGASGQLVPRKPDRSHRRRRQHALPRRGLGLPRRRGRRWRVDHPYAPGHDRRRRDGPRGGGDGSRRGQTADRVLDGRGERRRRAQTPSGRVDPGVPHAGPRGGDVRASGGFLPQPALAPPDPGSARAPGSAGRSGGARGDRAGDRRRAQGALRNRIQEGARGLPHSDCANGARALGARRRADGAGNRISGRREDRFARHHAQERRGRGQAQSGEYGGRALCLSGNARGSRP